MIELNWLMFCFLFLYVGQSAFNIWLERTNLIYSLERSHEAPAGFEGFIDAAKLARTAEYSRAKTTVGIVEEIASDAAFLAILLSGLLPLLVHWFDKLGLSLITAGLFFFFYSRPDSIPYRASFQLLSHLRRRGEIRLQQVHPETLDRRPYKGWADWSGSFCGYFLAPPSLHFMVAPFLVVLGFSASGSRTIGDGDPLSSGSGAAF